MFFSSSRLVSANGSCVCVSCVFPVLKQARKRKRKHKHQHAHTHTVRFCVHSHHRQHKALPNPHIFSPLITILFVVVFFALVKTFIPAPEISVIARRERQTRIYIDPLRSISVLLDRTLIHFDLFTDFIGTNTVASIESKQSQCTLCVSESEAFERILFVKTIFWKHFCSHRILQA